MDKLRKKPGRQPRDETGNRYGTLTVIKAAHRNAYDHQLWECHCDCGAVWFRASGRLRQDAQRGHKPRCCTVRARPVPQPKPEPKPLLPTRSELLAELRQKIVHDPSADMPTPYVFLHEDSDDFLAWVAVNAPPVTVRLLDGFALRQYSRNRGRDPDPSITYKYQEAKVLRVAFPSADDLTACQARWGKARAK